MKAQQNFAGLEGVVLFVFFPTGSGGILPSTFSTISMVLASYCFANNCYSGRSEGQKFERDF